MLKRSPSLTNKAKAHIKDLIIGGQYADGRIPSEADLASELGVSRTTIRDALSRLEMEGTVYRKQGSGTFVNRPGLQIKSRLDEIWSYEAVLEAHGYEPSVRILSAVQALPEEPIREALELLEDQPVTILQKLFSEDSEPVIFTENHIPSYLLQAGISDKQLVLPVYELLEICGQRRLAYYLSEIVPIIVDDVLADLLAIESGSALLAFEETGYDENNMPILWARSVFRDDLLRFRMIRRTTN